jgi:hypothetical protein
MRLRSSAYCLFRLGEFLLFLFVGGGFLLALIAQLDQIVLQESDALLATALGSGQREVHLRDSHPQWLLS